MKIFNFLKNKITVVTHNGSFHADDVFACATLSLWAEKQDKVLKIIRSRDRIVIDKADIVVDVGDKYDPDKNRFDHHQRGGAGEHPNGIPYASFGLVWKKYGLEVCGNPEIAETIRKKLVLPIDARDNGINISKNLIEGVEDYYLKDINFSFRSTWQDPADIMNHNFIDFFNFAKRILENEIRMAKSLMAGEDFVQEEIKKQSEPEILILEMDLPWDRLVTQFKNIKLVIYPEPDTNKFCLEVARDDLNDYNSNRISFPESWRGVRDQALVEESGVKGAIFCHKAGFFAVAESKEAALEMANKVLELS